MFKVSLDSIVTSWRGGEERKERKLERDRLIMQSIYQSIQKIHILGRYSIDMHFPGEGPLATLSSWTVSVLT